MQIRPHLHCATCKESKSAAEVSAWTLPIRTTRRRVSEAAVGAEAMGVEVDTVTEVTAQGRGMEHTVREQQEREDHLKATEVQESRRYGYPSSPASRHGQWAFRRSSTNSSSSSNRTNNNKHHPCLRRWAKEECNRALCRLAFRSNRQELD